jgi:hypothetical protein
MSAISIIAVVQTANGMSGSDAIAVSLIPVFLNGLGARENPNARASRFTEADDIDDRTQTPATTTDDYPSRCRDRA